MKKIISWESQHLEYDPKIGRIKVAEEEVSNQSMEGVQAKYYDEDGEEGCEFVQEVQEIMSTPFGLWKIDDSMNPMKQFKLWMAHTNFTITNSVVNTIKNIDGVEVLYVLTRYRFIVGVGNLFDFHDVRLEIEKKICDQHTNDIKIENMNLRSQVEDIKQKLSKCEKWAIYVFPNGNIDYISYIRDGGITESEFNNQIALYKEAAEKSNGLLIQS